MQRNSKPLSWRLRGLSDALDASDGSSFQGSMLSLSNLIPDPSTRDLWQCRPAAIELVNLNLGAFSSGFSPGFQISGSLGFISCMKVVGNFVYGMIASGNVPGFDQPFCFNLLTNAIVSVTGTQNATTLPASPPSTNAWTPPQMDVIGTRLMVAHSGFTGAGGNFIGWFDITTPSAPVWHAGNLTGGFISFTVAPIAVKQFNNRAYYIHNAAAQPAVIFSDALNAINCTNANQILTFNDNITLTALGALPLNNQLGGIIQSLIVFKGVTNMYQITGDAANSPANLTVNSLNVATGTLAPNSIAPTELGLTFAAPDGIRLINFMAQVSDPIGFAGQGVTVPFIYSAVPSRIAAWCNGTILRVTTQNSNAANNPTNEYWYHFDRKIWSGPHTFAASLIQSFNNTFIVAPVAVIASLWQSDTAQSNSSSFVENGKQLTWTAQTTLLPDTEQITNNCVTETTLDMALPPTSAPVSVVAADQNGSAINSVTVSPIGVAATTIWGQFTWGNAVWAGGVAAALAPYEIQWTIPLIFARMTLQASGNSVFGFKIGSWRARYQILRTYTNTAAAA